MIDTTTVERFLAGHRIAVIGASDDTASFGRTIYTEMRDRGYDVVAVHPTCATVADDPCYPSLGDVPGDLDGAIVMVGRDPAIDVVNDCVEHHIPKVWLFKGIGAPGSVSDEAIRLCEANGIEVVPGACPLMFLEPVGWAHKVHRGIKHLSGSLSKAS